MGILSGSLSGGQVTEVYLSGYRLATDEEGSAFSRQICEAMKASLGTYGIQQLSQKLRGEQETVKRQEDGQSGYEEEEVLKQYEESKQPEEGTEKTEGEGESGDRERSRGCAVESARQINLRFYYIIYRRNSALYSSSKRKKTLEN